MEEGGAEMLWEGYGPYLVPPEVLLYAPRVQSCGLLFRFGEGGRVALEGVREGVLRGVLRTGYFIYL